MSDTAIDALTGKSLNGMIEPTKPARIDSADTGCHIETSAVFVHVREQNPTLITEVYGVDLAVVDRVATVIDRSAAVATDSADSCTSLQSRPRR